MEAEKIKQKVLSEISKTEQFVLCPLCNHTAENFHKTRKGNMYYLCSTCKGIFSDANDLPNRNVEISTYKEHNNDVDDVRYQQFVSPIVNNVLADFTHTHIGLDFGAGTGPVISKLLKDAGYQILQYDPFFYPFPELLDNQYDYIACCEVIEHFHHPVKEFKRLKNMLLENGKLYCMTCIYSPEIDFKAWYYKNDPTHVFFYQKETIAYIQQNFGFSDVQIDNNLITFSN